MIFGRSSTFKFFFIITKQLEDQSKIVLIVLHLQQVIQISPSSKAEQIIVLSVNSFVGSRFKGS